MLAELTFIDYSLGEERIPKTCEYYKRVLKSGRPPRQLTERPHLASMARWCTKLSLENPGTKLPDDIVDLVIIHNNDEYHSKNVSLSYEYGADGHFKQPEFYMELRLNEQYRKPVYCSLLFFDSYTKSIHGSVLLKTVFLHGKEPSANVLEGQPIPVKIKDELYSKGVKKIHDYIKLIVSEKEFDSSKLEQDGDTFPMKESTRRSGGYNNALQHLMDDSNSLSLKLKPSDYEDHDWFAKTISLEIIRDEPKEI